MGNSGTKCLNCGGCTVLYYDENLSLYFWCDFCDLWYKKTPEGQLFLVESPKKETNNG